MAARHAYAVADKDAETVLIDPATDVGLVNGAHAAVFMHNRKYTGVVSALRCKFILQLAGGSVLSVDDAQSGVAVMRTVALK